MRLRIHALGDTAVLAELDGIEQVLALTGAVEPLVAGRAGRFADVEDVVPAARTLMLVTRPGRDLVALAEALREVARQVDASGPVPVRGPVVDIPVVYDGPDLEHVAELTGLSPAEVVAAHTGTEWTAAFGGFAPGFSYLVGGDPRLTVPRRTEPRATVPAGAVALAGGMSAVYPRDSPGGWQLVGRTDAVLWDPARTPPALLPPGTRVRFHSKEPLFPSRERLFLSRERLFLSRERLFLSRERVFGSSDTQAGRAVTETGPGGPVAALEVLRAGMRTLVQDRGRPGHMSSGVTRAGAADQGAHALGARLLGQSPRRASLEVVLGGAGFRARGTLLLCLTGAPAPATVGGAPVPYAAPFHLTDGQVLTLSMPPSGLRTYVSVRGGIDTGVTLGSRSRDTMAELGPPAVRHGDVLPVGPPPRRRQPSVDVAPVARTSPGVVELRVTPGPRADWFEDPESLTAQTWTVSSTSDRVGIRLEGKAIHRARPAQDWELASEGMVRGCIQVPPSGLPIVFLNDHPVTGGYPVIAVVSWTEMDTAAQLRPGQEVHFAWAR